MYLVITNVWNKDPADYMWATIIGRYSTKAEAQKLVDEMIDDYGICADSIFIKEV